MGNHSARSETTTGGCTIGIAVQGGGPKDGNIGKLVVDLGRALSEYCSKCYCTSIESFLLVLRINGPFGEFGPEAIDRIRRSRRKKRIKADIVIPEERWQTLTTPELKSYLARQVRQSLVLCAARLCKDGEIVQQDQLLTDVDQAIADFAAIEHPPNANRLVPCPHCGATLRSALAKQCVECGADWH
jgi:hypothetical protein